MQNNSRFCNQCGAKNADNALFCDKCGAKLNVSADSGAAPQLTSGYTLTVTREWDLSGAVQKYTVTVNGTDYSISNGKSIIINNCTQEAVIGFKVLFSKPLTVRARLLNNANAEIRFKAIPAGFKGKVILTGTTGVEILEQS